MSAEVHILGIRHHGPGSARSLLRALEALEPDCILVEGPPDAEGMLPLLTHAEMEPPVALLIHAADNPRQAAYFPFAEFSPEWQAIKFGLERGLPVRFMDLPQWHQLAVVREESPSVPVDSADEEAASLLPPPGSEEEHEDAAESAPASPTPNTHHPTPTLRQDPLLWLARAAGFSDGERWWEHVVEHRRDGADLFRGILEAMSALRRAAEEEAEPVDPEEAHREALREAWMRTTIRAAQKDGFRSIAVVCGAWHGPALAEMPPAREDVQLLKGLPKVKVQATWVPWTYGRLSIASGYGAGITSPGWYHHLWTAQDQVAIRWMTRVARLLRDEDLDCSSAHVIEAVRLAETLAALRDRPLPGLTELNEATQTVVCFGGDMPMRLIHDRLIVGERMGKVPAETPMVPLQADLTREQKRLRLAPEAAHRDLDLDLRKETDLQRSHLLHRLNLLGVPWGQERQTRRGTGTFREEWRIQWHPEFAIRLIEAGVWGNTVVDAATACAREGADRAPDLPSLTELANCVLLADLKDAVGYLMTRLESQAALTSDVAHLMDALPSLAGVLRYGNVRGTDRSVVGHVVDGLVARICVGLPAACASLNDEAAEAMYERLMSVHRAVSLLQNDEHTVAWHGVLGQLAEQGGLHGLIAGRACRLLLDAGTLPVDEAARRMGLALSAAADPPQAAAWVDGFLRGSGLMLLHDAALWEVLDSWITGLHPDAFTGLLPLLRRTFSTFPRPERREMGERVARGPSRMSRVSGAIGDFDTARAESVLPVLARLLGVEFAEQRVVPHE